MPKKLSKSNNVPTSLTTPSSSSSTPTPSSSTATTSSASITLPPWLHDGLPVPKLIVLDLDYTLWPFYSDIHIATPVRPAPYSGHARVTDRNGEAFALYPDAPHILHLLSSLPPSRGIRLAVASKSPVGDLCREMLRLLRLPAGPPAGLGGGRDGDMRSEGKGRKTVEVFDAGLEIYEGSKLRHFDVISKRTGIPFHEMLFFDDERPNREVEQLGVTMKLVEDGLTWAELERGINQWRGNRGLV